MKRRKTVGQRRAIAAAERAAFLAEERAFLAARLRARRAAKNKPPDAAPLSLAEQEARADAALNPGRVQAQDLRDDLDGQIAAAQLSAAERAWIWRAYTPQDRARRFFEIRARQRADDGFTPPVEVVAAATVAEVAKRPRSKRSRAKPAAVAAAVVAPATVVEPIEIAWLTRARLSVLEAAFALVEKLAAVKPIAVTGRAVATDDDDPGHLARITSDVTDKPVGDDEKTAPTRRTKKDNKP